MRKVVFMVMVCIILIIAVSNSSAIESIKNENLQKNAWEYEKIKILDDSCEVANFPAVSYNVPPDRLFRSFFTGKVVDEKFQQNEFNIFDGRLIIQMELNYVLYDKKNGGVFYLMIFDFIKDAPAGKNIVPGDIIGKVDKNNAGLLVFSETLDPYLVVSSNSPPVFYKGYFWFNPSFLSASGPAKWLSFNPIEDIDKELTEITRNLMNEKPGITVFDKRIRFKAKLSQYPRVMSEKEKMPVSVYENIIYGRSGIITDISEINAGGYNYFFCWQNGFREYLEREYVLGEEIWLYGTIVTYDVWSKKGYIFIRDFTPIRPEEIYEGRIRELKGEKI